MPTGVQFTGFELPFMTLIVKYIRERFNPILYLPLALLLILTGFRTLFTESQLFQEFSLRFPIALLLLLQFRLFDDLLSLPTDRQLTPVRITCIKGHGVIFWRWFFIIGATTLLLVAFLWGLQKFIVLFLLALFYLIIYRSKDYFSPLPFSLLILTKYPVISYLVSDLKLLPPRPIRLEILLLLAIYLTTIIYEAFHDRTHRQDKAFLYTALFAGGLLLALVGFALFNFAFQTTVGL